MDTIPRREPSGFTTTRCLMLWLIIKSAALVTSSSGRMEIRRVDINASTGVERGTRHILVVDDAGKLVGVVSIRDLVEDRALKSIGDRVWGPPPEE